MKKISSLLMAVAAMFMVSCGGNAQKAAPAEAAAEKIDRQIGRYEEGRASGMWNVGVYLFGDKANVTNAAYQFKAVVSGKSTEVRFWQ